MPYVLSPIILENSPGLWFEGTGYEKSKIYSIADNEVPLINYDAHLLSLRLDLVT